jgi:tetratricopeptide (TPR) repeat protein
MALGRTDRARSFAERALGLTDAMQSTFAKGRLFALIGWADVREGQTERARERFEQARALAEGILTEELISYRTEMLAWDDAVLDVELLDAAERLREAAAGESPNFLAWAHYGLARAAALRGAAREAADHAERSIALAQEPRERWVEWRSRHVLATALESLGRDQEAADEARRAAEWVESLVARLPADLRRAFEDRPLVREVLGARARLGS